MKSKPGRVKFYGSCDRMVGDKGIELWFLLFELSGFVLLIALTFFVSLLIFFLCSLGHLITVSQFLLLPGLFLCIIVGGPCLV